MGIQVKFWGVRGSFPCTGSDFQEYGGNTSCVEIRCGDQLIILDAGTGLQKLGETLTESNAFLLLTHGHIDHILGLPFFSPLHRKDFTLDIFTAHLSSDGSPKTAIERLMSPPTFPIMLSECAATQYWHNTAPGQPLKHARLEKAGIGISTVALNHPGGATGYRIEYGGKSVCYLTDIEHVNEIPDSRLSEFVKNCDLLIYDSSYDDREFESARGWGHSTWQQAIRLAQTANVRRLALFHHDHLATDAILKKREAEAQNKMPTAFLARDNLSISVT